MSEHEIINQLADDIFNNDNDYKLVAIYSSAMFYLVLLGMLACTFESGLILRGRAVQYTFETLTVREKNFDRLDLFCI